MAQPISVTPFRISSQQYNTSNQVTYSSLNSGVGLTYDAAGDVTYDGLNTYLYDAEGRICAVKNSVGSITGYVYDAAGIRTTPTTKTRRWGPRYVARLGLGAMSCNFAPSGVAWDIHANWALGQGGEQVAEFNGAGTWQHSNIFAGKLTGTYDTKGLHFYLDDWLGTRRIQTNSTGQLEMTCQSLPCGNGQNCITTSLTTADNPTEQFFTGKERDPESGDDYFEARYYNSAAGRFLSPDWSAKEEPVPYAKLDNPQSLNLYAYVLNRPTTGFDPDGHDGGGFVEQKNQDWIADHLISNSTSAQLQLAGLARLPPFQTDCGCATAGSFKGPSGQSKAAATALDAIYGKSQSEHTEYGGRIYKRADGSLGFTTPVKGGREPDGTPSVDVDAGGGVGSRIPAGTTNAGIYHTHPLIPGYDGEIFSTADAQHAVSEHVPSFIEAPSRSIYEIDGTNSNNYFNAPQTTVRQGPPRP